MKMKLTEMKNIRDSRVNLIAFLHYTDIAILNALFNGFNVNKQSFNTICNQAILLYKSKILSNKTASAIFDVLKRENTRFKTA